MSFISLRMRFLFLSLLVLASIFLLAREGLDAVGEVKDMAALREIVTLTKLQMRIDMMHDAIHGNVLQSLSQASRADTKSEELAKTQKDMEENIATAEASLQDISKLNIPAEFQEAFDDIQTQYKNYIVVARQQMTMAVKKEADAQKNYNKEFLPVFEQLANIQEKSQDEINEYSENTADTGVKHAEDLTLSLEKTALVVVVLSIFYLLYAEWSLFIPQRRLLKLADILSSKKSASCPVIPYVARRDEIGAFAKTLQTLKISLDAQREIADKFETTVQHAVEIIASATTEMEATAKEMATHAQNNQDKFVGLAQDVMKTTASIEQVSTAVQQISSAMNEISSQVAQASSINHNAVQEAEQVNQLAENLSVAAQKVDEINGIISGIASKINLLSLNATIEAARAGEAGKGFAVVASEVKTLANQTGISANEITNHVQSIQQSSGETLSGVKNIGTVITQLSQISGTIAAAIEEQGTCTQHIAKNMQEASDSAKSISNHIEFVTASARTTGQSTKDMVEAAGELSKQTEFLRKEVAVFLLNMRGGKKT